MYYIYDNNVLEIISPETDLIKLQEKEHYSECNY